METLHRQQSKSAPIMPVDEVSFLLDSFLSHTSPNATSYWFVTAENDELDTVMEQDKRPIVV